jgi:hypothetical protein
MSNLAEQIREALSMFARNGIEPALLQVASICERRNANARLGRHSRSFKNRSFVESTVIFQAIAKFSLPQ